MKVKIRVEVGQGQDLVEKSAQRRLTIVWSRRGHLFVVRDHAEAHRPLKVIYNLFKI